MATSDRIWLAVAVASILTVPALLYWPRDRVADTTDSELERSVADCGGMDNWHGMTTTADETITRCCGGARIHRDRRAADERR